jgi:phosphoribosylformimino-5-aminoimidazole carboxamide ribotide isomerase
VELYPAIDLRAGKVVRLTQGSYDSETVYGHDPVDVACAFEEAGAPWIHVVDLDGARSGQLTQTAVIAAVCGAVRVPVQCGGGVRDLDRAAALFEAGVARVVVGTAAVERPALVAAMDARWPGRVAVGLDPRGGQVRVHGWEQGSGLNVLELARVVAGEGAAALVVTDIARDGMLAGPDLDGLRAVLDAAADVPVIASGGVARLDDLATLADLRSAEGRLLAGVIVGKAIYEGKVTVVEALAACRGVAA